MIPTELIIALSAFTGFITGLYVQGWIDSKDWGDPQPERDEHETLEAAMADLPDYLRRQAE
mgnify:CR=1 FL=1